MSLKLVVRRLDGRMVKGTTMNFNPLAPGFDVVLEGSERQEPPVAIWLRDVKAIFFVRDFRGNRSHEERKNFAATDVFQGRRMKVTFTDGEVMIGSAPSYTPGGPGFFFFPVDDRSNTIKAWIPTGSVKSVTFIK